MEGYHSLRDRLALQSTRIQASGKSGIPWRNADPGNLPKLPEPMIILIRNCTFSTFPSRLPLATPVTRR